MPVRTHLHLCSRCSHLPDSKLRAVFPCTIVSIGKRRLRLRRHKTECNAWTWCADVDTCLDEHLRRIPYHGCQLKVETQQPAGLPSDEYVRKFRPSTLASGYVKRASLLDLPPEACLGRSTGATWTGRLVQERTVVHFWHTSRQERSRVW